MAIPCHARVESGEVEASDTNVKQVDPETPSLPTEDGTAIPDHTESDSSDIENDDKKKGAPVLSPSSDPPFPSSNLQAVTLNVSDFLFRFPCSTGL